MSWLNHDCLALAELSWQTVRQNVGLLVKKRKVDLQYIHFSFGGIATTGILKLSFRLMQFVTTDGVSVATNERKFSQLKFVKTILRSTMGDERLDCLTLLASEKDLTDKLISRQ